MMNLKYSVTANYILRFLCCSFIITFLATSMEAQQSKTLSAPNFTLAALFQAPNNAPSKLSDLRGNIVILDFWATWCAPCRTSMKHLNLLAQKFIEKPIRFLAISQESVSTVERFIKSNPNKLWIGIDATGEAHKSYGVEDIPHTVIIDKSGHIVAVTDSEEITEEKLNALLDGKEVWFEPEISAEEFMRKELALFEKLPLPKSIFKLFNGRGGNERTGKLFTPQYEGSSLQAITILPLLVHEVYPVPKKYIKVISPNLLRDRYYLHIQLPANNKQALRDTLKNLLLQKIEISIDTTLEKEKVWLLQRKAKTEELKPSQAQNSDLKQTDSSFFALKQPITTLTTYLSNKYHYKILDESGLKDLYDLSMIFHSQQINDIGQALTKYGLEVIESEKPIDIYVVKEKNTPNTVKQ